MLISSSILIGAIERFPVSPGEECDPTRVGEEVLGAAERCLFVSVEGLVSFTCGRIGLVPLAVEASKALASLHDSEFLD